MRPGAPQGDAVARGDLLNETDWLREVAALADTLEAPPPTSSREAEVATTAAMAAADASFGGLAAHVAASGVTRDHAASGPAAHHQAQLAMHNMWLEVPHVQASQAASALPALGLHQKQELGWASMVRPSARVGQTPNPTEDVLGTQSTSNMAPVASWQHGHMQTQLQPHPLVQSRMQSQVQSLAQAQLQSQLQSQLQPQLQSQTQLLAQAQLQSQLQSRMQPEMQSQMQSQTQSQLQSQMQPQVQSQVQPQVRPVMPAQMSPFMPPPMQSQMHSQMQLHLQSQLPAQLQPPMPARMQSNMQSWMQPQVQEPMQGVWQGTLQQQLSQMQGGVGGGVAQQQGQQLSYQQQWQPQQQQLIQQQQQQQQQRMQQQQLMQQQQQQQLMQQQRLMQQQQVLQQQHCQKAGQPQPTPSTTLQQTQTWLGSGHSSVLDQGQAQPLTLGGSLDELLQGAWGGRGSTEQAPAAFGRLRPHSAAAEPSTPAMSAAAGLYTAASGTTAAFPPSLGGQSSATPGHFSAPAVSGSGGPGWTQAASGRQGPAAWPGLQAPQQAYPTAHASSEGSDVTPGHSHSHSAGANDTSDAQSGPASGQSAAGVRQATPKVPSEQTRTAPLAWAGGASASGSASVAAAPGDKGYTTALWASRGSPDTLPRAADARSSDSSGATALGFDHAGSAGAAPGGSRDSGGYSSQLPGALPPHGPGFTPQQLSLQGSASLGSSFAASIQPTVPFQQPPMTAPGTTTTPSLVNPLPPFKVHTAMSGSAAAPVAMAALGPSGSHDLGGTEGAPCLAPKPGGFMELLVEDEDIVDCTRPANPTQALPPFDLAALGWGMPAAGVGAAMAPPSAAAAAPLLQQQTARSAAGFQPGSGKVGKVTKAAEVTPKGRKQKGSTQAPSTPMVSLTPASGSAQADLSPSSSAGRNDRGGAGCGKRKEPERAVVRQSAEAERQLELLTKVHEQQEAENRKLKDRAKYLAMFLQQMDTDQGLVRMVHRSPRAPAPLPASCSQISFSQLPHASLWDEAWVARVCQLTPQDLLVLRRQWLQQSAMLLPAAELGGVDSPAYQRLSDLHSRHISVVQSVVSLIPEVWLQMSMFDMDTLAPLTEAPTREWLSDLFHRLFPSDQVEAARSISTSYKAQTRKLDAEFDVLLGRYQVLAAALGLAGPGQQAGQQGGSGRRLLEGGTSDDAGEGSGSGGSVLTGSVLHGRFAGSAGRGGLNSMRLHFEPTHAGRVPASLTAGAASSSSRDGEDVMIRLDEVAGQMKVNTGKQLFALKRYLCDMQHSRPITANVKLGLVMYPLALNAVDFGRGLAEEPGSSDQ